MRLIFLDVVSVVPVIPWIVEEFELSENVAAIVGRPGISSLQLTEKVRFELSEDRPVDPGIPYCVPFEKLLLKLIVPGKWLPPNRFVDASTPVSLSTDANVTLSWLR